MAADQKKTKSMKTLMNILNKDARQWREKRGLDSKPQSMLVVPSDSSLKPSKLGASKQDNTIELNIKSMLSTEKEKVVVVEE
mmetsp:Transcript_5143/g.3831  ORF Transcript_5143/g.3831 Transcript_5143/m.3831 type:complete len:82 (+) Transcript_5143:1811-2056(+)